MLLILLTFLLLAGTAGAASAAPLIGALVAAVGLTGTAATVATALLTVGVAVGANLLISTLLSPRRQTPAAAQGISAEVRLGGRVPYDLAFGEVAARGHFVYWNQHGTNNRYLEQVYVLSSGWCDSLTGLYVNGEPAALTQVDSGTGWTKYAVTLPDDNGTRRMWVTFWQGRHDQDASPVLIANANPAGRWTSEHMLRGQAYAHVEAEYVAEMESLRSLPAGGSLLFVLKGLRLYDLRKDSTAGGEGAHRWDDWTTWEWSANPATCQYHFERGYYINGEMVGGIGIASYDMISALYMAAANVCDETVDTPDEGSEPRYCVSYISNDDMEYVDVVDQFVSAMAGQRVDRQGLFGVIAGVARLPVATITDGDLVVDAPVLFAAKRRREDLINEVYGQYLDPETVWDGADSEPVIGDAGVKAADGGETRSTAKNLYQVTSPYQARRLLLIAFRINRMQATATITLGQEALEWEVGDWITWRGRTWEISGHLHDTASDTITLSLTETAASVYSVGEGDVGEVPLPPTPPGLPARPTNVSGLTLQTATVEGEGGQAVPALVVGWDPVTDETIRTVEVEFRRVGETGAGERRTSTRPDSGGWTGITIAGNLMAGTDYEVRVTITTVPIRRTTWSSWQSIETTGTWRVQSAGALYEAATEALVPASEIFGGIAEAAEGIAETASSLQVSMLAQLQRILDEETSEGRAVDTRVREGIAGAARITNAELLIATESETRATQITALSADLAAANTGIAGNASAIVGLDTRVTAAEGTITSQSTAITALESGLGAAEEDISETATALFALDTRATRNVQDQLQRIVAEELSGGRATDWREAQTTAIIALRAALEGEISASATALFGLTARVDEAEGQITAQSTAITSLSTTVGGNTASITSLTESVNGLSARWGVAINTSGGPAGAVVLTGLLRNDGTTSSTFAVDVDTFVVGKVGESGSYINPFIIVDGVLYVNEAVIPTLSANIITAGVLQSANGKVVFDLDNGVLRVTS